jgi:hypothetical protein
MDHQQLADIAKLLDALPAAAAGYLHEAPKWYSETTIGRDLDEAAKYLALALATLIRPAIHRVRSESAKKIGQRPHLLENTPNKDTNSSQISLDSFPKLSDE